MEALFLLRLERKMKWGRESFISFSLNTEFWLQSQSQCIIAGLEMARAASPQLTAHFGLLTSCMKSRKQTNPVNVDKSTHALKKKTSFHIETGRTPGTLQICTAAGKFFTWLSQVGAGGVPGKAREVVKSEVTDSGAAEPGAERIVSAVTIWVPGEQWAERVTGNNDIRGGEIWGSALLDPSCTPPPIAINYV